MGLEVRRSRHWNVDALEWRRASRRPGEPIVASPAGRTLITFSHGRRDMARIRSLMAAAVLFAASFASHVKAEVTVNLSCSSLGIEIELCQTGADQWAKQTGNRVRLVSAPPDGNERLAFYQTL